MGYDKTPDIILEVPVGMYLFYRHLYFLLHKYNMLQCYAKFMYFVGNGASKDSATFVF